MGSVQPTACRPGATWCNEPGSYCWPLAASRNRDRPTGRGLAPDRHRLPQPLCAPRAERPARPTPTRPPADRAAHPPGRDLVGDAQSTPGSVGITHWSTRLLARELGVSRDTIARIWREY